MSLLITVFIIIITTIVIMIMIVTNQKGYLEVAVSFVQVLLFLVSLDNILVFLTSFYFFTVVTIYNPRNCNIPERRSYFCSFNFIFEFFINCNIYC